jgi:hypothetical protein
MYINGVLTSPEGLAINVESLRETVNETTFKGSPVEYVGAHNPRRLDSLTENDLVTSIQQKASEYGFSLRVIASAYFISSWIEPVLRDAPAILGDIQSGILPLLAELAREPPLSDQDLAPLVNKAKSVAPEKGLLIFGHSQGTFYANQVYDSLLKSKTRTADTMAISGAAVVANSISGTSKLYVTSSTDLVVNSVRTLVGALAATSDIPGPSLLARALNGGDPLFGHGFSETYTNPAFGFRARVKDNVEKTLDTMKVPAQCKLVLSVQASNPGWSISPTVELTGFKVVNRILFSISGNSGNTCGTGERGGPIYSADSAIALGATFWEAPLVTNPPYQLSPGGPNRRPCSSFVARQSVASPDGTQFKERLFANATGRIQTFTFGGSTLDWEYQLRFDSGDPWLGDGKRCVIGTVPGSGNFQPLVFATCTGKLVAVTPPT